MAILEKFKYYSDFIKQYVSTRFGILKFAGFAILLVLLAATKDQNWTFYLENFVFIFFSLFAFRFLDDLWSFYIDRIKYHERVYIHPKNIKVFVIFTLIVFTLYQTVLFFISPYLAYTILIFLTITTFLYVLFYKVQGVMRIIPLLKYPILIWCISRFILMPDVLCLSIGAFFIMLIFDLTDRKTLSKKIFNLIAVLYLIAGLLILQPWMEVSSVILDLVLIITPFVFVYFKGRGGFAYFSILFFPIAHIIDLIF